MSWWQPAATIGAGLLGAGSSLAGGCMGGSDAESAANAQARAIANASRSSNKLQRDMFNKQLEIMRPWLRTGEKSLDVLWNKVREGPGPYRASPDYSFRLKEGMQNIKSDAAMRGMLQSGPTLKALTKFGQDYATTDFENYLKRYYQSLTPYQSLANVGQTTGAGLGQVGANYANMMGNNMMAAGQGIGQARASGYINQANARTGMLGSLSNNLLMLPFLSRMSGGWGGGGGGWGGSDYINNSLDY